MSVLPDFVELYRFGVIQSGLDPELSGILIPVRISYSGQQAAGGVHFLAIWFVLIVTE